MATKARPWPYLAAEARDRSAEEAMRGIRALEPLLGKERVTEVEAIRRVGVALNALQTICRLLEGVGAQTRP